VEPVIFFTQPGCPPCAFAKNYFDEHNIPYTLKDIQKDAKAKKTLMTKYDSYSTPTFVIGDEVIIGFNQERIMKLLNITN
jgi:glutaredoxin-like YruB-family protein